MEVDDDVLIDAVISDFPTRLPGTRPTHAPGIAATGWFRASEEAERYSSAEHLSGKRIPVTVRFSNSPGGPGVPDSDPVSRGMAVKFHLGETTVDEHGILRSETQCDLVGFALPTFIANSVASYLEFTEAAIPVPIIPIPRWRNVLGLLKLQPPLPRREPGDINVLAFARRFPPARFTLVANSALSPPASYARCRYHPVHAFRLTTGDTSTFVRFQWEPVAGVSPVAKGVVGDYLHQELEDRLAQGPAEFILRAKVADRGDDTTDPTIPWPESRRRLMLGRLCIETLAPDQDHGGERLSFNPGRLVPGIEMSDDELLRTRSSVYRRSHARRLAEIEGATTA